MTSSPFTCALWAAVSSRAQATDDKISVTAQLDAARAAAARFGWKVVRELSVKGHSREYNSLDAALADIPELAELLDLARAGTINLLALYDLNRFRGLQAPVVKTLAGYGCQTYSLNQPVALVSPSEFKPYHSDAMTINTHVGALISDAEMSALRRRWETGMPTRVDAKGLHFNNRLPFGYHKPPGHAFDTAAVAVCDPVAAQLLLELKDRYVRGESATALARSLNARGLPGPRGGVWDQPSILYMLCNPWYAGLTARGKSFVRRDALTRKSKQTYLPVDHWKVEPGKHAGLWTPAEWEMLCVLRRERAGFRAGATRHTRRLSHLLTCGLCGARMTSKGEQGRGALAYMCAVGPVRDGHARAYERRLLADLKPGLEQAGQEAAAPAADSGAVDLERVRRDLAANDAARAKAQRLALRDLLSDSDLAARQAELEQERAGLEAVLREVENQAAAAAAWGASQAAVRDLLADWETVLAGAEQEINARLLTVIESIEVRDGSIAGVFLRRRPIIGG